MLWVIARFTSAVVLALCLGLAFTPLGCGGSQRDAAVSHPQGGEGPNVPGATTSKFRVCAEQGQHRLKELSYTFQFDVEMTSSGRAGHVKLKDSYPGESGIASCLARALEDMQVPPSVERTLLPQAEGVSPQSRGVMGNSVVLEAAARVELVPAQVFAAEVTVDVCVTVYLSEEVIETVRRKRESKGGDSPSPSPRVMPLGPCEKKCEDDYEDAAAVCGRMADAARRTACQDSAYARYKRCREGCQKKEDDDCLERCKNKCVDVWEKCWDGCKGKRSCQDQCGEDNAQCHRKCDRECK